MSDPRKVDFKSDTPWGLPTEAWQYAPGLIFVHTMGHGGFYLDDVRWAELKLLFPTFRAFNDHQNWLEEDCDSVMTALCWPDVFSDAHVFNAARMARSMASSGKHWKDVYEWLNGSAHPKAVEVRKRTILYGYSVAGKWERGGCSCGPEDPGWQCWMSRGGEERQVSFREYPSQQFYTEAELTQAILSADEIQAFHQRRAAEKAAKWRREAKPAPDQGDYSGAFDGRQVTSGADPGL